MADKRLLTLVAISVLTACVEPLETMQPPDRTKSVRNASEPGDAVIESEPRATYIETAKADADVVLDLNAHGPRGTGSLRLAVPMKRALVPGYAPLLPRFNLVGDRLNVNGQLSGAMHLSGEMLEVTESVVRVSVEVWWTDEIVGEGTCKGEIDVTMGSAKRDKFHGGCVVDAQYHRGTGRSNNRLKLPARGRPTPESWYRTRAAA